jgi:hypothetical protein
LFYRYHHPANKYIGEDIPDRGRILILVKIFLTEEEFFMTKKHT